MDPLIKSQLLGMLKFSVQRVHTPPEQPLPVRGNHTQDGAESSFTAPGRYCSPTMRARVSAARPRAWPLQSITAQVKVWASWVKYF